MMSGADTEVDRVVLESLAEPIAHMLRNAVKHGIETPAQRTRAGKPPRGRIELRAVLRGSIVEVAVADDGQGVSPEVAEEGRMAGSLADLLTRPGYSTAEEVTGVAGRGVGLDAVRDYVRSFGGSMEIRSEPGAGTEVVLLLPLALSLIEVLLFERGGAVYGLPLAAVAEVVTVTRALALQGRPMLAVRGRPVPLADVAALVGATTSPLPARAPALVIRVTELSVAVACDSLVGQQEIAVKPLGPLLAGADKFLGAAVLGDGRIALLIEPHALLVGLAEVTGPGPAPAAEPAAAPMVLVVEDSFAARELQRSILETAGYQVLTARDGREALDTLGREPAISLVVTDLEMPEIGGLELTRAIRADPVRSSLPVVVVTAHGSEDDVRKGIEAGADAYMAKRSFDQHALLATVERLVDRLRGACAARHGLRRLPRVRGRAPANARVRRRHHGGRLLPARGGGLLRARHQGRRPGRHRPGAAGDERPGGDRGDHELPAAAGAGADVRHHRQGRRGRRRAGRRSARGDGKDEVNVADPGGAQGAAFRDRVRLLARARVIRHPRARLRRNRELPGRGRPVSVIGFCASTGGPKILEALLAALPPGYPIPLLVVQHISPGFTAGLVRWLNLSAGVPVRVAAAGVVAAPGAWVAPEGANLSLAGTGRLELDRRAGGRRYLPSGDVLFASIAAAAGPHGVAVVLTGMGRDGARGATAVRVAGGLAVAQDEESSPIYGMPRAAAETGVDLVLSPPEIASHLRGLTYQPLAGAS